MGSFFFHCVFFFFFLMIRRPPRSPLFPYTPLSRSRRARGGSGRVRATPAFHPHRAAAAHPARRADRRSRTPPYSRLSRVVRLLVVRHAIAEDREAYARSHRDDAARPLTSEGRRKMEGVALGLRQLVPTIDLLAASPFRPALETAEIIAQTYVG